MLIHEVVQTNKVPILSSGMALMRGRKHFGRFPAGFRPPTALFEDSLDTLRPAIEEGVSPVIRRNYR